MNTLSEAKSIIEKEFLLKSGKLNCACQSVQRYKNLTEQFRQILNAESHLSVITLMYCIVNEIEPRKCLHCGKQLNVYRFSSGYDSGKGSSFCSLLCANSHKYDKKQGEVFTDYKFLLDVNSNFDSQKIDKHINEITIKHLQSITELEISHIRTLLYVALYGKENLKYCKECGKLILVKGGTKRPYTKATQFCSKTCRNRNKEFKTNLREINLARIKTEEYKNNVGIPWFESKIQKMLDEQNITILHMYEEIASKPRQSSYFRFKCNLCLTEFDARFISIPICKKCNPNSKPQVEISAYIESLGYQTIFNDRRILKNKRELDIVIPELNLAIEYDGLYWHKDKNDYYKYEECKSLGIRLIKIYDDENPIIVKSRIAAILGKTKNKIHGRKCKIVEIDNKTYSEFMNNNHIQGSASASKKYGLEFENRLVAVMAFCKSRYNKNYEWELIRFSNVINTTVVGGASRLFSHFVKENNPKTVLSYCDLRWGTGKLYENLGFDFSHKTTYNYYYMKTRRESRLKYQKHKLPKLFENVDMSKSEAEIMKENGYSRIYDFGNLVYVWKSSIK